MSWFWLSLDMFIEIDNWLRQDTLSAILRTDTVVLGSCIITVTVADKTHNDTIL